MIPPPKGQNTSLRLSACFCPDDCHVLRAPRRAPYLPSMSTPDRILDTYDRQAAGWDRNRPKTLIERHHLDRLLAHAPGRRVLDLGCGAGRPIAAYLTDRRATVTGVDGAPAR